MPHSDDEEILNEWTQGDVVLEGAPPFIHVADLNRPITEESRELAGSDAVEPGTDTTTSVATQPKGLVVVTQTCDIRRVWGDRPFVEVSPLVPVDYNVIAEAKQKRWVRFAYIPGVAVHGLVADLDRTMTLEKAILASLSRVPGCNTDSERRDFAEALARKRRRTPFPDDFNAAVRRLQTRLRKKHGQTSPEGELAEALREIRVRAAPDWNAAQVQLTFFFLLNDAHVALTGEGALRGAPLPTDAHYQQAETWIGLFAETSRLRLDRDAPWRLCYLADLTAEEFVHSDQLDLDNLSRV